MRSGTSVTGAACFEPRTAVRVHPLEFDSLEVAPYALGMCIICVDFGRGALKLPEARRALGEMRDQLGTKHTREVEEKLDEAEALAAPKRVP
jgi:hypothetical protein